MRYFVLLLLLFFLAPLAAAEPIVVIVRHAEKAPSAGNDPGLSAQGRARAEQLARMLKDAGITTIFTSEFKRTQETAAPAARALGITPLVVPAKNTSALAARLHEIQGNALVVGHGNTIAEIAKALGIASEIYIPEDDYTEMFIITMGEKPQVLRLHF